MRATQNDSCHHSRSSPADLTPDSRIRTPGPVWLNVASSVGVLDGYINLDNSVFHRLTAIYPFLRLLGLRSYVPSVQEHLDAKRRAQLVLHDCRRPLPFRAGEADHVLCSHFLEHVYPDEARTIVEDFFRVLRSGGTVHLIVPDIRHLTQVYLRDADADAANNLVGATILSSSHRPSWRWRLLEALGFEGLKHRWMYDERSLEALAISAGFHKIPRERSPSAGYRADDGASSAHFVGIKP